jgi:AcrR family transcriptional regulator
MNIQTFPTKGERTRAHIIASAASLFWRKSFNGVSVDDIAAEAQVNKATIYRYFADKADLALAVIRHQGVLSMEHVFEASMAANTGPERRLAAIYAKAYHVHAQTKSETGDLLGCPVIGLALELSFEMPHIREEAHRIFSQVEAYLVEIAEQASAQGRYAGSPDELGATLMQLMHGAFASARIASDPTRILDAGHASLALLGYPETRIIQQEQMA